MRRTLLLFLFAALALAAKPKLSDILDPAAIQLLNYTWPEWRKLPRAKRLETRGIDPEGWETPPPDVLTPEELDEQKKKEEEQARKTPEQKEQEKQARINAPGPRDRFAGFRFEERLKRKQAKFNKLAVGLPPSSIAGIITKLTRIDKLAAKYDKLVTEHTEAFLKSKEQLDRTRKQQVDRYMKKHGRPPDQVMVSRSLLMAYDRQRKQLQKMLSVQLSEEQFRKWLMTRMAELVDALPEAERGKPYAALAGGLKHKDWRQRIRCVAIVGHLRGEKANALFDAALAKESDPFVLAELIRLRCRARPDGVYALLAERLKDDRWQVRAAVIAELGRLKKKQSVEMLLAQLAAEQGRLKDDVVDALAALTDKRFDPDPAVWNAWWKKNASTWKPPARNKASGIAAKPGEEGKTVSFYGIPTSSKRIVFCLDVSGSMAFPLDGQNGKKAPRIDTAKQEMVRALRRLPADAMFTIVSYHSTVDMWKKKLVKATPANKKLAAKYIDKLVPQASTNIFDALDTSLRLAAGPGSKGKTPKADTIFFMTDGVPTDGRIVDPAQILSEITARNRRAGVVIHTIGVSKEQNAGFLLNLARSNGGKYAARK